MEQAAGGVYVDPREVSGHVLQGAEELVLAPAPVAILAADAAVSESSPEADEECERRERDVLCAGPLLSRNCGSSRGVRFLCSGGRPMERASSGL